MKEWILSYLIRFTTAVTHLFVLPFQLPHSKKLSLALPWFPVAGVLAGTVAYLIAVLLRWAFGPISAAIVVALLFPAFLYVITGGRHINSLLKASKYSGAKQAASAENELMTHLGEHASLLALLILISCKVLAVGALVYFGFCSWLIVVPLFSAAAYAEFLRRAHGLKVSAPKSFYPWFIALIMVAAIVGIKGFAVGCVLWFLSYQSFGWVAKQERSLVMTFFYSLIEILECVAILAGLFILQLS